ncbi:MAG TPA: flagellar FliJ family protein [Leptolinea sp.]
MPPKFSLQTVLDVRHTRVETLEIELGGLLSAQKEGKEMLSALQTNLSEVFCSLQEAQSGELDLFKIDHLRANIKEIQNRMAQVKQALAILEGRIVDKQKELVAAKQAEETLKTIKTKESERFKFEMARAENKQQDDVYISQAFRNRL